MTLEAVPSYRASGFRTDRKWRYAARAFGTVLTCHECGGTEGPVYTREQADRIAYAHKMRAHT